jgi:GT2 family glycosyltransferase
MTTPTAAAAPPRVPSVLAVLIVGDAGEGLRDCLSALAAQTYPKLGVLAVDDGSTDGSAEVLAEALGEGRVITLAAREGFARALDAAAAHPVAAKADFLLVVRDDVLLDPDVVTRLVEAAVGIEGLEGVGVVGAKIVDRDDPRLLRDVGRSADRFGHPYSPLQPGEIDQGQFDRVLEVLSVSSSAMLVSREAWQTTGLLDHRLDPVREALDLGWRARLAGFRVLMTPLARVRQAREDASEETLSGEQRYEEDRAAIASMLRNYSLFSLLWLLPLALFLGLIRVLYLMLGRRFEEAYDVGKAWAWNVAHLPGTLSLRRRTQKARKVKDRQLHRFMASGGLRLPRWFQAAERILEEQRELEEEEAELPAGRRLRDRTRSLVGAHPVLVASALGAVVGAVAVRGLLGPEPIAGGVLPSFPTKASGFMTELVSGFRTTGLGGSLAASPALALLGGVSWAAFGSTALAQKVVLAAGPALAAILAYRATVRLTSRPGPAVVAASSYGLCALTLWGFSEGRIAFLGLLIVLPPLVERLEVAFGREGPTDSPWRFCVGVGITLAVGVAFFPGTVLAVGVAVAVLVIGGSARRRGLGLAAGAFLVGAVLLFPFLPTIVSGRGAAMGSTIGTTELAALGRLVLGPAPGDSWVAWFLPVAAAVSFGVVGPAFRGRASRAAAMTVVSLGLAWASGAGWLPAAAANAQAYLALAAVGEMLLVAYGLSSVLSGIGRESFGLRQIATAVLAGALIAGIGLQAITAMVGGWAVGGPEQVPAAWAVVESGAEGDFRVLWTDEPDGSPFPAPGGDPIGVVDAGPATLAWGLTDRGGITALDTGRTLTGEGSDRIEEAISEILSGTTVHGGALLAPFGVLYVVAEPSRLPTSAYARLRHQVDLDLVPTGGLTIFRNALALPPAGSLRADAAQRDVLASSNPAIQQRLTPIPGKALNPAEGGWNGAANDGALVFVGTAFDGAWELEGSDRPPDLAAGWATSFPSAQGPVRVRYGAQLPRTISIVLLAIAWVSALWITRKSVGR